MSRLSQLALVLTFIAAFGAPAPTCGRENETPVLLITIDTLRADRLGCYGARQVRTPAMDALAAQGVRFERALSHVPLTPPSHAVILTGTYPMYTGVREFTSGALPQGVGVIAEAFQRHGYDTAAFVSSAALESSWGFSRGFQLYDDYFNAKQANTGNPQAIERRAEETVRRLLTWLHSRPATGGAGGERPFFVWLHLYDPHYPYDPPEPFRSRYAGRLYDGEIAYVDHQLARLFQDLRQRGLYNRSLIVLLSDHGESLGEHGEDEHGFFIYDSTLHVPLIFKLPSGLVAAPRVIRRPVGLIDVAPTLLALLHLVDPLSRQFQGISLAPELLGKAEPPPRPVYSETFYPHDSFGWSELRGISTDRFKYIQAPRPELYDLRGDPQETHNLCDELPSVAAGLRSQLERLEKVYAAAPRAIRTPLPAETVDKLRSLGYVAYSAPAAIASGEPLADPKDKLQVFQQVVRAQALNEARRPEESNRLLATLVSREPHLFVIPFLQAENFSQLHRWYEAEQSYRACLRLNPHFERALMGLARAYLAEGEPEKARPLLELVVREFPRDIFALYALGRVAQREGNHEQAYRYLLQAAEAMPYIPSFQEELGIALVDLARFQEALGPLLRASQLGQEDARLEHYLGTALANLGRFQEAVQCYQKALKLEPKLAAARLSLAFAYLNLHEPDNARREFQAFCQQSPAQCSRYRKSFE